MATHQEAFQVSPGLVRKLGRENREMGVRLAQLEFHNMKRELENPKIFDLKIDFPGEPANEFAPPLLNAEPVVCHLPKLNVTLGKIAWVRVPEDLPVIGIFIPRTDHVALRDALLNLITAHYAAPFARMVFLCEDLRPIPLLGRYQFTIEHLANTAPQNAAIRLNQRFGAIQIRNLITGALLWRAKSVEEINE